MSKYSLYKRQRIISLSEDGHKLPTIAKILHEENLVASRQGIQKFLKRYESSGAISRKEGTGKKSKVTEDIRRLIDEKMEEDDETSGMQLQKMLLQYGHRLSKSTILKCRRELGWTRRGSAYCQMIRVGNKVKRFQWTQENIEDDFSDCIFSDETTVQLETHRRYCSTKSGIKPRYKPKPKHLVKVHVRAAISKRGCSGVCIFEGCMGAVSYVKILEQTLLPMINELYPDQHRFVQDNNPKHTLLQARKYYKEKGINWWPTPAKSPDANPIENLWHELKEFLRREVNPRNEEQLVGGIEEFWETVDRAKCIRYVNHLKKVLPRIVECGGGPTGY